MPADHVDAHDELPEDGGAWYRIVVAREHGDTIVRGLAEEAASMLRARGAPVLVTEEMDLTPPPDGLIVVAAPEGNVDALEAAAGKLEGRSVALTVVTDERPEGKAVAVRLQRAFRDGKALVVPRRLIVARSALGIYGLEDEDVRDKLDGIIDLLLFETDKLHAKRTGWEEPDTFEGKEWLGPQVEREAAEDDEV